MSSVNKPLHLFRAILKEHKYKLPVQMRMLGDKYVKNEFLLHKNSKGEQLNKFLTAWIDYLNMLKSKGTNKFGKDIEKKDVDLLNAEQLAKLKELKVEAEKSFNS